MKARQKYKKSSSLKQFAKVWSSILSIVAVFISGFPRDFVTRASFHQGACIRIAIRTIFILFILTLIGCGSESSVIQQSADVEGIEAQSVEVGTALIHDTYSYVGTARPSNTSKVVSRVSSLIVARLFTEGDYVKEGHVLYLLDDNEQRLNEQKYQAEYQIRDSHYRRIDSEYSRRTKLFKTGAISESDIDYIAREREGALAAQALSRTNLELAQLELDHTKILAPIAGRVGRTLIDEGGFVQKEAQVLTTIQTLDPINIEFSLTEKEFLALSLKQPESEKDSESIRVKGAGGISVLANIDYVGSGFDPGSNTIVVRARAKNPEFNILPGMYLDIEINKEQTEERVVVPFSSIRKSLDLSYVFVIDRDGFYRERQVQVGAAIGDQVVIENGLQPGEKIAISNLSNIRNGARFIDHKKGNI